MIYSARTCRPTWGIHTRLCIYHRTGVITAKIYWSWNMTFSYDNRFAKITCVGSVIWYRVYHCTRIKQAQWLEIAFGFDRCIPSHSTQMKNTSWEHSSMQNSCIWVNGLYLYGICFNFRDRAHLSHFKATETAIQCLQTYLAVLPCPQHLLLWAPSFCCH